MKYQAVPEVLQDSLDRSGFDENVISYFKSSLGSAAERGWGLEQVGAP